MLPDVIRTALDRLQADLQQAAGPNLAGLVLYGGLARGRYRPGRSDVNVLLLLNDTSAAALAAIAPALATARRAVGVEPMLLAPAELARSSEAFPTKFLDIKNHHVVLVGPDPFANLEITREQIRRRTAQELQNLLMRLRQRYVAAPGDSLSLTRILGDIARPFALELAALLGLAGKPVPDEDRTAALFQAAASAFNLDAVHLARLANLRQSGQPDPDVQGLFRSVLESVGRAADAAARMQEDSP